MLGGAALLLSLVLGGVWYLGRGGAEAPVVVPDLRGEPYLSAAAVPDGPAVALVDARAAILGEQPDDDMVFPNQGGPPLVVIAECQVGRTLEQVLASESKTVPLGVIPASEATPAIIDAARRGAYDPFLGCPWYEAPRGDG